MEEITLYRLVRKDKIKSYQKDGMFFAGETAEDLFVPEVRVNALVAYFQPLGKEWFSAKMMKDHDWISFTTKREGLLVANGDLAEVLKTGMGKTGKQKDFLRGMEKLYLDSLMPIEAYRFGTYRLPEVLVPREILPS